MFQKQINICNYFIPDYNTFRTLKNVLLVQHYFSKNWLTLIRISPGTKLILFLKNITVWNWGMWQFFVAISVSEQYIYIGSLQYVRRKVTWGYKTVLWKETLKYRCKKIWWMIPSTPVSMKPVESFFNGRLVFLISRFRLSSWLYTLHK